MTFTGFYMDGDRAVVLETVDRAAFLAWVARMTIIRERASTIVSQFPDAMSNPTPASNAAMTDWVASVAEAESRGIVLPSIAEVRDAWTLYLGE